ncbi:MAG TPA: lysylphosphatidylglycerol synthase transmembrane domain-containing protein [Chloroflexia bacterium]|nr:lysylphosphatidylglycerol synthase transmembrane domain-containing protein [Chloroflexia bacterium]
MTVLARQRNKILGSVAFAILVYAIFLGISDYTKLSRVLQTFQWSLLPLILFFSVFNYALRFLKWHFYLHLVGVRTIRWPDSLLIFLSGFSMTITPGKAGEWLKSLMVKQVAGTPIATTAPIILAERMTDGLAMLLLAGAGLFLFDSPLVRVFMVGVVVLAVIATALVQNRRVAGRIGQAMRRIAFLDKRVDQLRAFYNSAYELLRVRNLLLAIALGFISWSGECVALFLILTGMGVPPSWQLLVLSSFAMGTATLVGSVLLLPGGLGATEGSIEGLLVFFGQAPWLPVGVITHPVGTAATLLIRFATLWFGVALGFIALAIAQMRFGQITEPPAVEPATPVADEREPLGAIR